MNRMISTQKKNEGKDFSYDVLMEQKMQVERKINRLKHRYQNNLISGGVYYKKYEKLGHKLIEIERDIIKHYPHKSLNL